MTAVFSEKNSPFPTIRTIIHPLLLGNGDMGQCQAGHSITVTLGDRGEGRVDRTTKYYFMVLSEFYWAGRLFVNTSYQSN